MTRTRAVLLSVVALFVSALALAGPTSAHVTVTAPGATRGGGDQEITFRVPVEEDRDTVGLTVQLPTATPIASVDVLPVDGWTHTQRVVKLATPIHTDDGDITSAVSQITWKARAGRGLTPGEFGEFTIIAGQLPDTPSLTFRALQTYSDGSVVRWIETAAPGSNAEPEHPAPVLDLASEPGRTVSGAPNGTPAATSTSTSSSSSNTGPVVLSIIALVIAAAALGLAVVGRARGGASSASETSPSGQSKRSNTSSGAHP